MSMVESVVSSSFSSGDGWLWWLVVNVGDWSKFCGVFNGGGCVFYLFFSFFWKPQNPKQKPLGIKME